MSEEKELEEIIDNCKHRCPCCEGSGLVYADFKAHLPNSNAPVVSCRNCGGVGEIINIENLGKYISQKYVRRDRVKIDGEKLAVLLNDSNFIYENTDDNGDWIGECLEKTLTTSPEVIKGVK